MVSDGEPDANALIEQEEKLTMIDAKLAAVAKTIEVPKDAPSK